MELPVTSQKPAAVRFRERYATDPDFREREKVRAREGQVRARERDPERVRAYDRARMARWREENTEAAIASAKRSRDAARDRAKEFVNAIKVSTSCADCGEFFPAVCMDFDHLVAGEKESAIGTMVSKGLSVKRIAREVSKCEVVCACCHRVRTLDRWAADDVEEVL